MYEKRELRLEISHISFKNIITLAQEINKLHSETMGQKLTSEIGFIINYFNGSKITSDDIGVLSESSVIDSELISSIMISYMTTDHNEEKNEVHVVIFHGNSLYKNKINLESSNTKWMDKINTIVVESLHPTHNLSNIFTDHSKVFKYTTALSFGFLCILLFEVALNIVPLENFFDVPMEFYEPYYSLPPILYWPIKYSLSVLIGLAFASKLTKNLMDLYPFVDLRTGTHHINFEQKRQKLMITAFSIWIMPLLVSIIKTAII